MKAHDTNTGAAVHQPAAMTEGGSGAGPQTLSAWQDRVDQSPRVQAQHRAMQAARSPSGRPGLLDAACTAHTGTNAAPIQRYAIDGGAKVSQSSMFRTSPDKKSAFVRDDALGGVQGALAGAENSKITVENGGAQAFGDVNYVRIVPALKEAYAEDAIESQLALYKEAWNYIGKFDDEVEELGEPAEPEAVGVEEEGGDGDDENTAGMDCFDTFIDEEIGMEDAQSRQTRLPLDCKATSQHLQVALSMEATANPAVGSNYQVNMNEDIQGTLTSAIKGWNFHYASIIAKDHTEANDDNLSFEVGAEGWVGEVMNQITNRIADEGDTANLAKYAELLSTTVFGQSIGRFDIYGTQTVGQTFDYVTYSKLVRHMLDQIQVQMDSIPHLIKAEANPEGNLERMNQGMSLMANKINELKEQHGDDRDAIDAGILAFAEGFELVEPMTPEETHLMMLLLGGMMGAQPEEVPAQDEEEQKGDGTSKDEEEEPVIPAEPLVQAEPEPYSTQYKNKTLEILGAARVAFALRREELAPRGHGFAPVVAQFQAAEESLIALRAQVSDMNPGIEEDGKEWPQTVYRTVRTTLSELKTAVPLA